MPDTTEHSTPERRAAHERLSTGALAALHPRVREPPVARRLRVGRDHRAPDRLGRHDRRRAQGRVRDPRLGDAEGNRPDRVGVRVRAGRRPQRRLRRSRGRAARHARARGSDRARPSRACSSSEFEPTEDRAGLESVGDPLTPDTTSEDGRIAYAEAQFDRVIYEEDRDAVVAVQDAVRETVEPVGVTVEYNGEAEFPPVEQGASEALGLLAAIIVLLLLFRTFVAMIIPIALAITAVATAFLLLFILAGADRHQHDHADPRLDDRAGRRDRLLAVHRHAFPAVAARRALSPARRLPRQARRPGVP